MSEKFTMESNNTDLSNDKRPADDMSDEQLAKRRKLGIPDGMSKSQWKKLQKQKRWEETKDAFHEKKREKKKLKRKMKREEERKEAENEDYHRAPKKGLPETQIPTGVKIIMDCDFDDLMNEREIVSLSTQISRCYATMRHASHDVGLEISGFTDKTKERFEKSISQYKLWKNIQFTENKSLKDILPTEGLEKYVYFSADTDNVIESLDEGYTYIIGGIVDKNRHKNLCANKAKELGIKIGRLPIDKYIKLNSRSVLATSHVYEICCQWFEQGKDWEKAFNQVLPPRKIKGKKEEEEKEKQHDEDEEKEKVEENDEENDEIEEDKEDLSA